MIIKCDRCGMKKNWCIYDFRQDIVTGAYLSLDFQCGCGREYTVNMSRNGNIYTTYKARLKKRGLLSFWLYKLKMWYN